MPLKLNISDKGKSWKVEVDSETLSGKSIGDSIHGKQINEDLDGYELEITGGSDSSGFPMSNKLEGIGLKRMLLSRGWGFWTKPKGIKKKRPAFNSGLRMKKSVRGKTVSEKTAQLNLKVTKHGHKKLVDIFPDQNKAKEAPAQEAAPAA